MIIEMHALQSFAPNLLNRDDTGMPKDCTFGGYRRARVSSQSWKRAIRQLMRSEQGLDGAFGLRSKRLSLKLAERLERAGWDADNATKASEAAFKAALGRTGERGAFKITDGRSEYLLFFGPAELDRLTELCIEHRDALLAGSAPSAEFKAALGKSGAVDIALFGRMLAHAPDRNVQAAAQVAHAISTHRASPDLDYYTAVDDLRPEETQAADMIGTIGFNAACYYRYAALDVDQLTENLDGDEALVRPATRALVDCFVRAVPSGKQATFAAHNPPSIVLVVGRYNGCWSLANAFLKPVMPNAELDLVAASAKALDDQWASLAVVYGEPSNGRIALLAVGEQPLPTLQAHRVGSLAGLLAALDQWLEQ
jgi:CRISPR system Cascade subunit CasC